MFGEMTHNYLALPVHDLLFTNTTRLAIENFVNQYVPNVIKACVSEIGVVAVGILSGLHISIGLEKLSNKDYANGAVRIGGSVAATIGIATLLNSPKATAAIAYTSLGTITGLAGYKALQEFRLNQETRSVITEDTYTVKLEETVGVDGNPTGPTSVEYSLEHEEKKNQ